MQFDGKVELSPSLFKPFYFSNNDSSSFSFGHRYEFYFNDNAPNQENMDVRYFTKGYSIFNSFQFSLNTKFLNVIVEPFYKRDFFYRVKSIERSIGLFNQLNDRVLDNNQIINNNSLRNFLFF